MLHETGAVLTRVRMLLRGGSRRAVMLYQFGETYHQEHARMCGCREALVQ